MCNIHNDPQSLEESWEKFFKYLFRTFQIHKEAITVLFYNGCAAAVLFLISHSLNTEYRA